MESKFTELLQLNVNDKTEKRKSGGTELTYLSWSFAWAEFKKVYPDATYKIQKFDYDINGRKFTLPYMFDPETGYMAMTEVTAEGLTYEMWLPVMDGANKAMKSKPYTYSTKYNGDKTVESADMFDVNKTIMRCLVKNLSLFGLGLYIYAGEDLPPVEKEYITKEQYDEMIKLGVKINKVLESYGINDIKWLEKSEADYVINAKRQYLEKQKEKSEANGNTTK